MGCLTPQQGAPADAAETGTPASMTFPWMRLAKVCSSNCRVRPNAEIQRRTGVVGMFANAVSITQVHGAMTFELQDEWRLSQRHMPLQGLESLGDTAPTRVSALAR